MGTDEFNAGGNPAMDWHPIQGGVEIFLVASCYGNRDKLRPDRPVGLYADFAFTLLRSLSTPVFVSFARWNTNHYKITELLNALSLVDRCV